MDFCTRELDLTIFFKMSAKKPQFVTLKPTGYWNIWKHEDEWFSCERKVVTKYELITIRD